MDTTSDDNPHSSNKADLNDSALMPPNAPLPSGFFVEIPFVESLGLRLDHFEPGHSHMSLDPQPRHLNSWGVVHGGVLMTMLDVAMSAAGRTSVEELRSGGNATIEMKTSFMRPAKGALKVIGTCLHRSTTMTFCEAQLMVQDGTVVARATGTFKIMKSTVHNLK